MIGGHTVFRMQTVYRDDTPVRLIANQLLHGITAVCEAIVGIEFATQQNYPCVRLMGQMIGYGQRIGDNVQLLAVAEDFRNGKGRHTGIDKQGVSVMDVVQYCLRNGLFFLL